MNKKELFDILINLSESIQEDKKTYRLSVDTLEKIDILVEYVKSNY